MGTIKCLIKRRYNTKKINKLVAIFLALSICITAIPMNVFAESSRNNKLEETIFTKENMTLDEYSKTDEAKEIYNALSDKAKQDFDRELKLLIYQEKTGIRYRSVPSLTSLGLPGPVVYSLQALMSTLAAAALDGPLPIGDILAGGAIVATAVTLGIYWDQVAPKWDKIVDVFKYRFGSSVSGVFSRIFSQAKATKGEIDKAKSDIPNRLKDKNGNVDLGKFKNRLSKGARGESGGWKIEKDNDGHKGSKWKLKNKKGKRKKEKGLLHWMKMAKW